MSSLDREAPSQPETETVALPDEHDRELLDYLIERAMEHVLRNLGTKPANDNDSPKRGG